MTLRLRVGRKGYIILPKAVREAVGIGEGDEVVVEIRDGIVLKPARKRVDEEEIRKPPQSPRPKTSKHRGEERTRAERSSNQLPRRGVRKLKAFLDTPLLVCLNTIAEDGRRLVYEDFYLHLLPRYKLYIDVLVLDELIYVSKKKYRIPTLTLEFIEAIVLPYTTILELGEEEYREAAKLVAKHGFKPSDALHLAAMKTNDIGIIVREDKELDREPSIKRIRLIGR